jgi:hypothetical protein
MSGKEKLTHAHYSAKFLIHSQESPNSPPDNPGLWG